jgi:hypothetical protein
MVESGVNEEIGVGASRRAAVPGSRLDADSVTDGAELFQLTIGNNNTVLAEESDLGPIRTPHNILNFGGREFAKNTATLNFEENSTIIGTQDNTSRCSTVIQTINIWDGSGHTFGGLVVHILDNNLALVTVQHGETIASQKDSRTQARSSLPIRDRSSSVGQRESNKFITSSINLRTHKNIALLGIVHVVRQESGSTSNPIRLGLLSDPTKTSNGDIYPRRSSRGPGIIMTE